MLSVLRDATYRRLFAAQVIALLGTGLLTVALGLLAFDLAGKEAGAVMGTALTIKMFAYVGFAPVINALVARLPKKPVLIGADLVRAAMALCLSFITEAWQIYVVIFLLQSASATFTPAFQSLIPAVLKDEKDYTRALSLSRLAYDLEALLSPAIAALLLGVLSYNNLFLGTVGGFLFSALMVIITTLPATGTQAGGPSSLWHRTTLGARIFWRNRRLRSLLALNLVVSAPTALVLVNSVVVVREVLHRPDTDLALALACFGIGSMLVALGAPRLLERLGDRAVMLTGAALIPAALAGATALLFLPASDATWWWLLGLWFLLGAGNSTILTPSSRLLREASTEETRPYVFTAQFSLSHACYIISYPLAGLAGAVAGLGPASLALTLLAMIGAAGAFLSWPRHTPGPLKPSSVGSRVMSSQPDHGSSSPAPEKPSLVHDVAPGPELLETAAGTLRMLAEPTRLHLLWQLADGPKTVTELTAASTAPRTVVSQHLAKLRLSGLVDTRKDGRHVIYSLHDGHLIRLIRETMNHADHRLTGEPTHG